MCLKNIYCLQVFGHLLTRQAGENKKNRLVYLFFFHVNRTILDMVTTVTSDFQYFLPLIVLTLFLCPIRSIWNTSLIYCSFVGLVCVLHFQHQQDMSNHQQIIYWNNYLPRTDFGSQLYKCSFNLLWHPSDRSLRSL